MLAAAAACRAAAWAVWVAWAAWTTKSSAYSLTKAINNSRVPKGARLFFLFVDFDGNLQHAAFCGIIRRATVHSARLDRCTMQQSRWLRWILLLVTAVVYWTATVVSIVLGCIGRVDKTWLVAHHPWTMPAYDFLSAAAPAFLPIAVILLALSGLIRQHLVPSRIDLAIKKLLDDFRARAFPVDDPQVTHRVTLFKHCRMHLPMLWYWHLPWSGCLLPYERAGEFTLKSRTFFFAPKDDPDNAQGFAGTVFKNKRCEYVSKLPALVRESGTSTRRRYAEATGVDDAWIRARLRRNYVFPRCMWGIPVEVDGSRIWGVLVIDSRAPELPEVDQLKEIFKPLGGCLSKLLGKPTK